MSEALGIVRTRLQVWSKSEFGSVRKKLKTMRDRLEHLRSQSLCKGPSAEEKRLMSEISELLAREEMIAKQRLRVQ